MWASDSRAGAISSHVGSYLKSLSLSMDLIMDFGNGLLEDLLALHRTVSFHLTPGKCLESLPSSQRT